MKPIELDAYLSSLFRLAEKKRRKAEKISEELRTLKRQIKAVTKELANARHEQCCAQIQYDRMAGD